MLFPPLVQKRSHLNNICSHKRFGATFGKNTEKLKHCDVVINNYPVFPHSLGLWLSGRHCDQPVISAWSPAHPLYQEALFPQSADLLRWPGHRDALLQRCASAHTRGLSEVE